MPYKVGVLTISDACSAGRREDTSGQAIVESLPSEVYTLVRRAIIPDEYPVIVETLRSWVGICDLILTTGGTGLSPRDVTPEATLAVIERPVPGISEALRIEGLKHTPMAILSRGVSGIAGQTLIINLPGSPKGVKEGMELLLPLLEHALGIMKGEALH